MSDQPLLTSPMEKKVAKYWLFASVLFLPPHFFGFSFIRLFDLIPADVLSEIKQNPDGMTVAFFYRTLAVYEVAVAILILSVVSLIFSGIAIVREVLITVLPVKWSRGGGAFLQFGLVFFAVGSFSFAKDIITVNEALLLKTGGPWGAAVLAYIVIIGGIFASALNLLKPEHVRRHMEHYEERRYGKTPKT
ncbi:hypothetical protein MUY35_07340 [Aliiroseovarius sp. S1339]|uniref:hypothetical protein n=1 Tax=Aliiroseovarius sp. S1339 TaxID=2936990 RepID=UPI0020BE6ACA|nr:hypothetical protein [Aliiroseovarius sp. S1339]MCK8463660.1 hypothetical protein [Aliiroseovarius sp. S1339]